MPQRIAIVVLLASVLAPAATLVSRQDLFANSDPGVRIHVREVRAEKDHACEPILLVHGARVPGVASFDLPVPGGSLAADLAEKGFCIHLMDIRGYSGSTRPAGMEEPPQNHPPLVRSVDAVRDIDAAVELIRKRTGASRMSPFGWATGGQWAGIMRPSIRTSCAT